MKKGFIGPYQIGILSGFSEALRIAEDITKQRGVDLEGIFYSTAFQAGIDEFLIPEYKDQMTPNSDFIKKRTTFIKSETSEEHYKLVGSAFSSYLPENWHTNEEFISIWSLHSFLVELLEAMSLRSSLLLLTGIPDFSEAEALLPSELAEPISLLLSSIVDIQTPSPIPRKAIPAEDMQRFNEILSSDMFTHYVEAQAELDNSEASIEKTLPVIAERGRQLFTQNKHVLTLKKSSAGILKITPKIIDAAFGKLPGALSEVAAKLGIDLLESRQRVVIYDFRSATQNILLSNLSRMMKAAENKSNNDEN